ncbi:PaaX family transcriptional regulator [Allosalinactinospora lopnorensis]|uniref:PaaX family transcriptional regulator n=1 Tax=Allosalinactinospora lopnorensis TaxID=1352348 RepID=UPI0009E299B6|nr:PaaX family transcriptional regulator C-terminal domain-containing protein [Allosalinactinospora lopnorensis]
MTEEGHGRGTVEESPDAALKARPQSLMLTFLGTFVLRRDICVFSGSYIDVFARLGVSEQAVRSTLSRMARRGLLSRRRRGRRVYFGLTPHSAEILADGERRIWETGVLNLDGDAPWTLLAFSLPEAWQRLRHDLRSRLVWAGFGPLQSGLWVAPSRVDVTGIITELGLDAHVRVFRARLGPPTETAQIIADAYDLDDLRARYTSFLERWDVPHPVPEAPDDLARLLLLMTEWLRIVRADPRLPLAHLPENWPAVRAQKIVQELHADYLGPARKIADEILDVIPADPASAATVRPDAGGGPDPAG